MKKVPNPLATPGIGDAWFAVTFKRPEPDGPPLRRFPMPSIGFRAPA